MKARELILLSPPGIGKQSAGNLALRWILAILITALACFAGFAMFHLAIFTMWAEKTYGSGAEFTTNGFVGERFIVTAPVAVRIESKTFFVLRNDKMNESVPSVWGKERSTLEVIVAPGVWRVDSMHAEKARVAVVSGTVVVRQEDDPGIIAMAAFCTIIVAAGAWAILRLLCNPIVKLIAKRRT